MFVLDSAMKNHHDKGRLGLFCHETLVERYWVYSKATGFSVGARDKLVLACIYDGYLRTSNFQPDSSSVNIRFWS